MQGLSADEKAKSCFKGDWRRRHPVGKVIGAVRGYKFETPVAAAGQAGEIDNCSLEFTLVHRRL